ncbi:serine/threonine-protein phosphatase 2A activator-like [Diorhabda sublineata]|uniref:serine/threonine-protein phosphatase 2A activator-like n=1 Tax=Diorhabda sublineata TaxID=1163346 RepID=UPI0024E05E25|nr:serine/threonine-protein phosphatase 2A activator-like [Diorhabda sublineata]
MANGHENNGLIPADHEYIKASKMVKNIGDMQRWEKSEAYKEFFGFICTVNISIKAKSNSAGSKNASESVNKICELLEVLDKWIDEIPPINQPQRFGNQAYRKWHSRLEGEISQLLQNLLPEPLHKSIIEIKIYLIEGFGNSTRIDYGTGHELSFLLFLCALFKIGYLQINDQVAIACKVFVRYLELVRKLQITYHMEPAGSRGVWSLDDYQFVPFIWGSSQFMETGCWETTCFLNPNIVDKYANEYMFLSCIQYINSVKTGPFPEHSNQLWSISAVSSWSKINTGLLKMYKDEVLAKFPLVQHIYFGSIFTLKPFTVPVASPLKSSFYALNQLPSKMNYCNIKPMISTAVTSSQNSAYEKVDSSDPATCQNITESKDKGSSTFKVPSVVAESSTTSKLSSDFINDKGDDKKGKLSNILKGVSRMFSPLIG